MNPASGDFDNRAATSPALFNRCVVDWFGDWSRRALSQVGKHFTASIDLEVGGKEAYVPTPSSWETTQRLALGIPDGIEHDASIPSKQPTIHEAVIATLVYVHENVRAAGSATITGSRQRTHKFVSPRDYIDFISHVVDLFSEKRSCLEDQQLHLNIGLNKLKDTATQVGELQQGLSEKEILLTRKNSQANEKLQQMVLEQNQAEKQKKEAQELQLLLDERNAAVDKQRESAEKELAHAEPALKEAQKAVSGIQKKQLDEIRALARPPEAIRLTMEAVTMMLNPERIKDHGWRSVRSDMRAAHFVQDVVEFNNDSIAPEVRRLIQKKYLNGEFSETFNYEKVQKASKCTGPLFKWVASNIEFAEIKERIEPLRAQVEALAKESQGLVVRHQEVSSSIQTLEESIAKYKNEYAELIKETEKIKSEMITVVHTCDRARTLLESLEKERHRWEKGSETFLSQLSTLLGDVMLASGFVSYIGFFDQNMRELLVRSWRIFLKDIVGVSFKQNLSLVEYLSTASERIEWNSNSLPDDVLCVENAIILSRFHRCVVWMTMISL